MVEEGVRERGGRRGGVGVGRRIGWEKKTSRRRGGGRSVDGRGVEEWGGRRGGSMGVKVRVFRREVTQNV